MSRIIVQKFGGTSLKDAESRNRAVTHIQSRIRDGYQPVVVVSAIGRMGDPYATDTLLSVAKACGGDLSRRDHDLLVSCGETISSVVLSQTLIAQGTPAVPLTGAQAGIVTDTNFRDSRVSHLDTTVLNTIVGDGRVPVVTGFQGVTEDGEVTTLGRGGSDTSACIVGAALDADAVEIFTDVDGVMTADPRVVPRARLIARAEYLEVRALALKGARVIHPAALEFAANAKLPLTIRSTVSDSPGTVVHFKTNGRPVTGVASFSGITLFRLTSSNEKQYASNLQIFHLIAEAGISIHFIDVRPGEITFVAEDSKVEHIEEILGHNQFEFETDSDFTKVSVIGVGMTGKPGMMSTIVHALVNQGIGIYQSTDSQTSISCLVRRSDENLALNCLHDAFQLDQSSELYPVSGTGTDRGD